MKAFRLGNTAIALLVKRDAAVGAVSLSRPLGDWQNAKLFWRTSMLRIGVRHIP